jgi:hypothetical protein
VDRIKDRSLKKLLDFHVNNREQYAKWIFAYFLILLIYRWHSGTFLTFIYGQPMKEPQLDHLFWLSLCAGFPHFIIQHYWACFLVDTLVVILALACLLSEKHLVWWCRLLLIFFFIQKVTVEIYSCSHSKSNTCVFVAMLPFCFRDKTSFTLLIETGRYFLIYILVSSSFHKLNNGELMAPYNFAIVLVNQHSDLATLNPQHICYRIASALIAHPLWAAISYELLFFTQASFLAGVFTKNADRLLLILLVGFAVMTYYIMRIYNFDIVMLGLTLLYFPASQKLVKKTQNAG